MRSRTSNLLSSEFASCQPIPLWLSLRRLMRRGHSWLEFCYRNESNVWIQPIALTPLVLDEQMFGRVLAKFLLVAFAQRDAATAHSLSNRPLSELEAVGQLV